MILTKKAILANVENGSLRIEPFNPSNVKAASYTFTLGTTLRKLKTADELDSRVDPVLEEVPFSEDGYLLNPGEHILGVTKEKVTLNGKFACILSTRPTIALMGLDVMQSSFFCEPNTDNSFTLEITNGGLIPVRLYPGIRITSGIFIPATNTV